MLGDNPIELSLVVQVADKLYREANPDGIKDTPSFVYEKVESFYREWIKRSDAAQVSFYMFCREKLKNTDKS